MSARALHLHVFWDETLPNRYAAGIQILRTGAALTARGHRFTCHCRALSDDAAEVLAHYGAPAEGPALAPFFLPPREGRLGAWLLARRLKRLVAGLAAGERHALVVRGATALRMAGPLIALARHPRARRPVILFEMHNLHFLRSAEKRLGRIADADALDDPESRALKAKETRLIAAADGLICLTDPVGKAAAGLVPELPPSLLLPSGTDLPPAVSRPPPHHDVVYAGKVEPRKGVGELVAAMAHLPARSLAVAGGPEAAARDLARTAAALGLGARVHFAGLLPPPAVARFLAAGRVGACPLPQGRDSVSETFTSPMKLLQMMALGLPVVATDVPPVRAIVTDGVDGLLAAPNDPAALAGAIGRLLGDPPLAARIGEAARRRVADFSWERRAEKLERFLDALTPG